jgi:deazaflavin-dependent oxidoreductase (nitroreductase family)
VLRPEPDALFWARARSVTTGTIWQAWDFLKEENPDWEDPRMTTPSDFEDFNAKIIEEFRANEGKVGGPFEGANMVLITTTGAKSGNQRTNPLVYLPDGERIVIIASNGGADNHPAWFYNVKANPEITVEVGTDKYDATTVPLESGTERDELFARMVAVAPGFAEYEQKTKRVIPVVAVYRKV